jgi:hypothetical protein
MQHPPSTSLADQFAGLRHSCAQLPPAHALLMALLLRLLGTLESLSRAWSPARTRRPYRGGKGPQLRDWMAPCHPTRKLRPSPPPHSPHARKVRAPPPEPAWPAPAAANP